MRDLLKRVKVLEQSGRDDILFTVGMGTDSIVKNTTTGEEFICKEGSDWRSFLNRISKIWGIDLHDLYWNVKPEDVGMVVE